jgi:hypothetical protein
MKSCLAIWMSEVYPGDETAVTIPWSLLVVGAVGLLALVVLAVVFFGRSRDPQDR